MYTYIHAYVHAITNHYIPLQTITCHHVPLHTITYRCIPMHTIASYFTFHFTQQVTYHYIPVHTITNHYIPLHAILPSILHTVTYHFIPLHTVSHTVLHTIFTYLCIPLQTINYIPLHYMHTPLVDKHSYGQSASLIGKSTTYSPLGIFNSYIELPEGILSRAPGGSAKRSNNSWPAPVTCSDVTPETLGLRSRRISRPNNNFLVYIYIYTCVYTYLLYVDHVPCEQ